MTQRILGIYFPVSALTFCVGVRNCPSPSRWVANKQPPVLDRGKHRLRGSRPTSHKCAIFSEFDIYPRKISSNGYCWGRLNMCVPLISSDSKHSGDGNCVKGRVFPLITLLVIWRLLLECSSNLKASQGYFQLIIHTCHLEAEAALSIIANQR